MTAYRRVGRYELVVGATSRYGARSETVFGVQHTRLSGGHTVHLLWGRFGVFAGYWGTK